MSEKYRELLPLKNPTPFAYSVSSSNDGKEARYRLDGVIGFRYEDELGEIKGATAASFIDAMRAQDGEGVKHVVEMNSPGGILSEAVAIATSWQHLKGTVHVHTYGVAASAASYLAVMADEHLIAEDASFMIHEAQGGIMGRASRIASYAESVAQANDRMTARYVEKSTAPEEDVRSWLAEEKWFDGLSTVAVGFADGLLEASNIAACADIEDLRAMGAPDEVIALVEASADGASDDASEGSEASEGQADGKDTAAVPGQEEGGADTAAETGADEGADAANGDGGEENQELDAEAQSEIQAVCAVAKMQEKAAEFIAARASIDQVRAQLFDLMASADAAQETNTRIAPAAPGDAATGKPSIERVRMSALEAVRGKRKI